MFITKVIPIDKRKCKVTIEGEESFALYRNEISIYQIEEGKEIEDETYEEIQKMLLKRAKERMLYLLNDVDRTEKQISDKLMKGGYPKTCIEAALLYGRELGYLDDDAYAKRFIEIKQKSMSRKQMEYKLMERGISSEIRKKYLEEIETEEETLEQLLRKKHVNYQGISREEKQKICNYFMRKGFSYEMILKKITELGSTQHLT